MSGDLLAAKLAAHEADTERLITWLQAKIDAWEGDARDSWVRDSWVHRVDVLRRADPLIRDRLRQNFEQR